MKRKEFLVFITQTIFVTVASLLFSNNVSTLLFKLHYNWLMLSALIEKSNENPL